MKKFRILYFALIILFAFLLASCDGNQIEVREYESKNQTVLRSRYVYDYNAAGYCIKQTEYDSNNIKIFEQNYPGTKTRNYAINATNYKNGSVTSYREYSYNSNGNRTEERVYGPDKTTLVYRNVNEYSTSGYRVKQTQYDANNHKIFEQEYSEPGSNNSIIKTSFNTDGSISRYQKFFYDSNGNQTELREYESDKTTLKYRYEYEFNADGYRTKETGYDANGDLISITILAGTSDWRRISYTEYSGNLITSYETYEYDSNGNETERRVYESDKTTLRYRYVYEYNADGYQTKRTQYDSNDNKTNETVYSGTSPNRTINRTYYNTDGSIYRYQEYIYDTNGNQIEQRSYESDKNTLDYRNVYEFNAAGYRIKETQYDSNNKKISESAYRGTNSNNYRLNCTYFNSDGSVSSYEEYSYDGNGNQTEVRCFESDKTTLICYYAVEYNAAGYCIKETQYDSNNIKRYETEYRGTRTNNYRMNCTYYNSDGSVSSYEEYSYDSNGQCTETRVYGPDKTTLIQRYEY